MSAPLRLATRGSALATAQSRAFGDLLAAASGREVELVTVVTRGDVDTAPLATMGGEGVFVAAVREALLDGRADVAVHSLKDLPTAAHPGLELAAVPARVDPRDVLVARDGLLLHELPEGARIGTGSPRRVAQLRAVRPDLELVASAATSTPGCARSPTARSTRSCSPAPASSGSAASRSSPRCSTR
jgi:hydroxymethylbilane synthase